MKKYFLSYNSITKDYYLDYGCFDRGRENLGKGEGERLIRKLREMLPMHREIIVYTQKDINDFLKELLLKNFKNTRVKVQFEKSLESLC
jgi:hypothetical protein